MRADSLTVSEIFGPTVQGEGPSAGRRCAFLRLGLCNLNCSWCDTAYTWDWHGQNGVVYDRRHELHRMPFQQVRETLDSLGVDRLVITGGEPLAQRKALEPFVRHYLLDTYDVEVETNGTQLPIHCVGQWNVSPKLSHSGVSRLLAWKPGVLTAFYRLHQEGAALVCFKFVVRRCSDLDEVAELRELAGIPAELVWVMPEGRSADELNQDARCRAVDRAIECGYNVTGRLQVELWGDKRGH